MTNLKQIPNFKTQISNILSGEKLFQPGKFMKLFHIFDS